eukprot:CAMPEP_0203945482 /NCGR_PEP_ID=MMETSP0359-20131031/80988_1 /ASSEMBLY_ACC=CAM_ASM_000338 /TAXON_ID=268821 /ORGANISM="Scrippsiella Hangoei, Strain SHTV-5" /LENGTH=242 /DNA_ID=CAMNT_0050876653 /DNA_START=18 /DNA_END=746 /DNA_ORIENTATION=-
MIVPTDDAEVGGTRRRVRALEASASEHNGALEADCSRFAGRSPVSRADSALGIDSFDSVETCVPLWASSMSSEDSSISCNCASRAARIDHHSAVEDLHARQLYVESTLECMDLDFDFDFDLDAERRSYGPLTTTPDVHPSCVDSEDEEYTGRASAEAPSMRTLPVAFGIFAGREKVESFHTFGDLSDSASDEGDRHTWREDMPCQDDTPAKMPFFASIQARSPATGNDSFSRVLRASADGAL